MITDKEMDAWIAEKIMRLPICPLTTNGGPYVIAFYCAPKFGSCDHIHMDIYPYSSTIAAARAALKAKILSEDLVKD